VFEPDIAISCELMTAHENVPDPDRASSDQVSSNDMQMPQIFNHSESDQSDDENEEENTNGYVMISQDEGNIHGNAEEQSMSIQDEVAALVRAAQTDENNLSPDTQTLIAEAQESQRKEATEEMCKIWADSNSRGDSIKLDDEKVETIKTLMASIRLPSVPAWASNEETEIWKQKLNVPET